MDNRAAIAGRGLRGTEGRPAAGRTTGHPRGSFGAVFTTGGKGAKKHESRPHAKGGSRVYVLKA